MSDDDLGEFTRALRDEGDRPAPQAKLTRERILRDVTPRPRRLRWTLAVPLAAVLTGGAVLAASGKLPELVREARQALGVGTDQESGHTPQETGKKGAPPGNVEAPPAPDPESAPAPPQALEAVAPVAPGGPAPVAVPGGADAGASRRAAHRPKAVAAPSSVSTTDDAAPAVATPAPEVPPVAPAVTTPAPDDGTLALYRKAHKLHFVDQNPAAALAAWDAYLASDPRGPLSVDARYDRALCLLKLGRKEDARRALAPFAAGTYGAFRKTDGAALIDAIDGKTP